MQNFNFSELTFADLRPGDLALFYELKDQDESNNNVQYCLMVLAVRYHNVGVLTSVTWLRLWTTAPWPEPCYTVVVSSKMDCAFKVVRYG